MAIQLSTKERLLMQDQKSHEELCISKYQSYANQAKDPALSQLFDSLAQKEQEHLNSINQILNGQVPSIQQGKQTGSSPTDTTMWQTPQSMMMEAASQNQMQGDSQQDSMFCKDMLSTEKFVSSTYNTAIFECASTEVRQVLNHIQKEEQEHGEQIFKYMQSKGMYNVQ
jgi:spore coat protein CotF